MKNRLLKIVSIITCFTIVLLTFIGCGNSNTEKNNQTIETDTMKVTYNGYSEEKLNYGSDNPAVDVYKIKLRFENKSDMDVSYIADKIIIDGETFKIGEYYGRGFSSKGDIGAKEKKGDEIYLEKEKIEDANIKIDEIKKIEVYMRVGKKDQKAENGEKYYLGIGDPHYPLLESPKIVFEF